MTLCIAATCINDITDKTGQPAIVLCADTLIIEGASSSETGYKLQELGLYAALYSGTVSEAHELLSVCRDSLRTAAPLPDPLSTAGRLAQLRQPLEDYKRRKIDHLVRMRIGMGHADFLERSNQIDTQLSTPLLNEIWSVSVDVELLFANVTPGPRVFERSFIFRLNHQGLEAHKNFSCIGEGAIAAEQSLHGREQNELRLLSQTLYNVYEAKRMGELARSVGKQTSLAVMEPDDGGNGGQTWKLRFITTEAKAYLADCFLRYGPQRVGAISFPGDPFIDRSQSGSLVPPPADPPDSTASE